MFSSVFVQYHLQSSAGKGKTAEPQFRRSLAEHCLMAGRVRLEKNINVPDRENCASAPASLETMELEFALGTRIVAELGFEFCVTKAAEETGARVLFQLPVFFLRNCQRAAAVLCGNGSEKTIALVLLDADGRSIRIENSGEDNPIFCLAHSYVRLLDAARSARPPDIMNQSPFDPGGGRHRKFRKAKETGADTTGSA